MEITLKDVVKGGEVTFSYYRAGYLYYEVINRTEVYRFPVPVDDTGDATFNKKDKAILFMRYIRKAMKEGAFVLVGGLTQGS